MWELDLSKSPGQITKQLAVAKKKEKKRIQNMNTPELPGKGLRYKTSQK